MLKNILLIAFTTITTSLLAQSNIPLDSMNNHIGEKVKICAAVFGVKTMPTINFINVGAAYPDAPLTVVIFAKDSANFKEPLSTLYGNKKICVTGTLTVYKGKTQIVVSKPDEIEVE